MVKYLLLFLFFSTMAFSEEREKLNADQIDLFGCQMVEIWLYGNYLNEHDDIANLISKYENGVEYMFEKSRENCLKEMNVDKSKFDENLFKDEILKAFQKGFPNVFEN
ncbi:hypothetical protein [uncultured Cohaesibacter sp.]|uniref:hypothetical protein n=1 Tax=uncultured Cohaesibacter sp. TaxID=1002546 RepID=UPI00292DEA59|nr:hypothetical protein [uncultured Cohaesibacter sp.]